MALLAYRLEVEAMQPQVIIILKIVHRGDVVRILKPFDVVGTRVFAD
jgi:hypothetical protein